MRIVAVSRDRSLSSWLNNPPGSKLSFTIQNRLSKTPQKNPLMINHWGIQRGSTVEEIHGGGYCEIPMADYIDHPHKTFYFFRYKYMQGFDYEASDKWRENIKKYHDKGKVRYDTLLLFRIWWHIQRGGLENLTTNMDDMLLICTEYCQMRLEQGLGYKIYDRLMLPNDVPDPNLFIQEDIDGNPVS